MTRLQLTRLILAREQIFSAAALNSSPQSFHHGHVMDSIKADVYVVEQRRCRLKRTNMTTVQVCQSAERGAMLSCSIERKNVRIYNTPHPLEPLMVPCVRRSGPEPRDSSSSRLQRYNVPCSRRVRHARRVHASSNIFSGHPIFDFKLQVQFVGYHPVVARSGQKYP